MRLLAYEGVEADGLVARQQSLDILRHQQRVPGEGCPHDRAQQDDRPAADRLERCGESRHQSDQRAREPAPPKRPPAGPVVRPPMIQHVAPKTASAGTAHRPIGGAAGLCDEGRAATGCMRGSATGPPRPRRALMKTGRTGSERLAARRAGP